MLLRFFCLRTHHAARRTRHIPTTNGSPLFTSVAEQEAPSFSVTRQQYNFNAHLLNIPVNFARCNGLFNRDCVVTIKDKNGRSWAVNLKYRKCLRVYFGRGWRKFSEDNRLTIGDVCKFELLSTGENVVMEFTITSHSDGKEGRQKELKKADGSKSSAVTPPQTNSDEEKTPYFSRTIKRPNYLPAKFVRTYGLTDYDTVTLRDQKGRLWLAMLGGRIIGQVYIQVACWRKFSEANGLKLGDECTFKLVSTGKTVVFEVSLSCPKQMRINWSPATQVISNGETSSYFTTKIVDNNICFLCIPMHFARSNGLLITFAIITLIDESGNSWKVKMRYNQKSRYVLIRWREISTAKNLKLGDVCTLKLLSGGENVVFNVAISHFTS